VFRDKAESRSRPQRTLRSLARRVSKLMGWAASWARKTERACTGTISVYRYRASVICGTHVSRRGRNRRGEVSVRIKEKVNTGCSKGTQAQLAGLGWFATESNRTSSVSLQTEFPEF